MRAMKLKCGFQILKNNYLGTWNFGKLLQLIRQSVVAVSARGWGIRAKCRGNRISYHGRKLRKVTVDLSAHIALISRSYVEQLDYVADRWRIELGQLVKSVF